MEVFETAARYQMYHGLAIVLIGAMCSRSKRKSRALGVAALLFLVGVLLFSGSLYALATTEIRDLGKITPFGGLAFIAGWVVLASAPLKTPN